MTPASYDDVVARVRGLREDLERPPVVGISGHGGAGKTTLAMALAADLDLEPAQVVKLDRLTHPTRQWTGEEGRHDVAMPPVLVIEGIRLLWPDTRPLLDLAVWIDLDPERAGARAVARNREQGDDDAELDLWRTRWVPEGAAYEQQAQPARLADLVVPGHV